MAMGQAMNYPKKGLGDCPHSSTVVTVEGCEQRGLLSHVANLRPLCIGSTVSSLWGGSWYFSCIYISWFTHPSIEQIGMITDWCLCLSQ